MSLGFNLNVTYGLKPQVSSIKIVTVYRRSIFQLWVTVPQGQHHVSSAQQLKLSPLRRRSHLDEWPTTNTTCCNNFFFFILFRRRYERLQNCPAFCDVILSISQLFITHFAMSAFVCIFTISCNRPNKQSDPSFEFLSILLTFGRLKQQPRSYCYL